MTALRVLLGTIVLAGAALGAVLMFSAGTGSAAGPCTLFASPSGSDADAGTEARPFRTVQRLSDQLAAGDVGCLRAGTYTGDVEVTEGGSSVADATITAYPDEKATILGRLVIDDAATYLTIEGLSLVGIQQGGTFCRSGPCPSPTVNADNVSFVGNDVTTDHRAICFVLGGTPGRADDVRIVGNRIHDCGVLPQTNESHAIYAQATTDAVIADNWIYDNADKGILLYPDAQSADIRRNVIYGNGDGIHFGAGSTTTPSDNVVERNVISHSNDGFNISAYWGGGATEPSRNVVAHNCLYGGHSDPWYNRNGGVEGYGGYTASSNTVPSSPGPGFIDAAAGDLRLIGTSACLPLFTATSATSLSADSPSPQG